MSVRGPNLTAVAALGAAAVLALAPGGAGAAGGTQLTGKVWQLTSLGGKKPLTGTSITLELGADGKLSGSSGCNSYGGTYTAGRRAFEVAPTLVSTQMACAEPVMAQETAYVHALLAARAYTVRRGALTLRSAAGKQLLSFAVQSQALAGTSWKVVSYNDGKALVSVLAKTELTAAFGKDGKLTGSSGCNRYDATYTAKAPRLELGPIAATRMACGEPAGVMEQESAYLAALGVAATYRIEGPGLELRNAKGAAVVSLTRA